MPSSAKSSAGCSRAAGSSAAKLDSEPGACRASRQSDSLRARSCSACAAQPATPASGRSDSANARGRREAEPGERRAARRDPLRAQLVQLVRARAGRGAPAMRSSCGRSARASAACASAEREASAQLALGPEPRGVGVGAGRGERGPAGHVDVLVVDPLELELGARAQQVLEPRALARLAPGLEARAQVGHRRRILGYLAPR